MTGPARPDALQDTDRTAPVPRRSAGPAKAVALALAIALGVGALGAGGTVLALAMVGSTVHADEPSAATGWTGTAPQAGDTPDDAAAVALLARAVTAQRTVAYVGVTASRSGSGEPVELEVAGVPGTGTVVRTADSGAVLAGEGRTGSLADASSVLVLLRTNYAVRRASDDDRTVAGRPAYAVEARRSDGSTAARFWVDSATGLLVRRDLVGGGGRTTSSTWFTSLRVGAAAPAHLPPMAADPWPHVLTGAELDARRAAGCRCALALPGGLTLVAARVDDATLAAGPGHGTVHLLYSDGLVQVSLFDEPGSVDDAGVADLQAQGFTPVSYAGVQVLERVTQADGSATPVGEWVWTCGSSVQTLVGPASPGAAARRRVADVVGSLDYATGTDDDGGLRASVGRGWDRVTGAVGDAWDRLTGDG